MTDCSQDKLDPPIQKDKTKPLSITKYLLQDGKLDRRDPRSHLSWYLPGMPHFLQVISEFFTREEYYSLYVVCIRYLNIHGDVADLQGLFSGKMKSGESPLQAGRRESTEECGLDFDTSDVTKHLQFKNVHHIAVPISKCIPVSDDEGLDPRKDVKTTICIWIYGGYKEVLKKLGEVKCRRESNDRLASIELVPIRFMLTWAELATQHSTNIALRNIVPITTYELMHKLRIGPIHPPYFEPSCSPKLAARKRITKSKPGSKPSDRVNWRTATATAAISSPI
jgi:8-oxo-dGTP pyrophosphatase MutT (NUDIX family)